MKNHLFALLTITTMALTAGRGSAIAKTADPQPQNVQETLRDTLPQRWELEQEFFQTTPTEDNWWKSFHDPALESLIEQAVSNNFNVLTAIRRIETAALNEKYTKSGYYPTLGISGGWNREMTASTVHGEHPHESTISFFHLGLTANWEIDIFGRIHAQLKADKANYDASVAEYDAAMVSLCSNVAKAYFQLRQEQELLKIAEETVKIVEEQKVLADARYEAGLRPLLDVVQARMSIAQTRSTLPQHRANVRTSLNQIALLVGVYPEKLESLLTPQELPEIPSPGNVGAPASLLRRRPDIVAAEKQLAATAAQVGIAKKDFLPTLSVSAAVGSQVHTFKDLYSTDSYYYNIVPTLTWSIFEGMARNAKLAEARLTMETQIDSYNQTVMTAVSEVNNAMLSIKSLQEQQVYQEILLKEARKQLELQTDRFLQGLTGFSDISGSQATVLQYENSIVQLKASLLGAVVTLYTALGGGY